ncbi:MAG: DUF1800 family protein [Acidimicrobiia bacterium]
MALNESDIAHLLRRTETIATPARIAELSALSSIEAAVDSILVKNTEGPITKPQGITRDFYNFVQTDSWFYDHELRRWWVNEFAYGKQPLREKMTLFWHGHFTSSSGSSPYFGHTLSQNNLYRTYAFGNLVDLAKKMSVEPTMLQYLNNAENFKWKRNENFARELMELFLLGLNHYGLISGQAAPYTQDDVVAASKAWTGHVLIWDPNLWPYYLYKPEYHDNSTITFLGKTGAFDGFAVIDQILTVDPYKTIAARYIATKLWSFFAYPNPDAAMIASIVTSTNFANTMDIKSLLRAILVHPNFYSDAAKLGLVSTPTEFMARVFNIMGVSLTSNENDGYIWSMEDMGQELLNPPNVAGWKQNSYWLSTSMMGTRGKILSWLFYSSASTSKFVDLDSQTSDQYITQAARRLGLVSLQSETKTNLVNWLNKERTRSGSNPQFRSAGVLHLLIMSPDFQLS